MGAGRLTNRPKDQKLEFVLEPPNPANRATCGYYRYCRPGDNAYGRQRRLPKQAHQPWERAAITIVEDGDEPLTLHDCLAANVDDPAMAAARHLDWASVFDSLDRTAEAILVALVEGRELTLLVRPLKRCRTALHYDKVKLGRLIQACLGHDVLVEAQSRPGWRNTLDAIQERLACRAERRAG